MTPEEKIEKLMEILNCKNATELTKALGNVAHSTISRWKNKIGHPSKELIEIIILQDLYLTEEQKELFSKSLKNKLDIF